MPIILIAVTIAVYAVTGGFQLLTWDDSYYLATNETVRGITSEHLHQAFTDYFVGNYAPVHILSYMLDYSLWGYGPTGYHLENVLLHAICGVLFYYLLRRLNLGELQAGAAAWIFLFHPVQVETVAWVAQRKSLLSMIFFLTAFHAYIAYSDRNRQWTLPYLLSLISLAIAELSKSIAVVFPVTIVLYDITLADDARSMKRKNIDKLPFILLTAGVAFLAIVSQSVEAGGGRRGYPGGSPLATFYTMVPVLVTYLQDCVWPFNLSPYYMTWIRQTTDITFFFSLCILIVVAFIGFWLYKRSRRTFFWYGLFFIGLVPVMQIVPIITLKNDRYLYFPLLGFSVLAVIGISRLQARLQAGWLRFLRIAVVAVLLALPILAWKQTTYWRDDITLWSRAVEIDPENRLGWLHLAKAYTTKGDGPKALEALDHYQTLRNKYGPVRGFEKE